MYLDKDTALPADMVHKYSDSTLVHINTVIKELRRLFLVEDLVDSLKVCLFSSRPEEMKTWSCSFLLMLFIFDLGLYNCSQGEDWKITLLVLIFFMRRVNNNAFVSGTVYAESNIMFCLVFLSPLKHLAWKRPLFKKKKTYSIQYENWYSCERLGYQMHSVMHVIIWIIFAHLLKIKNYTFLDVFFG